MLELERLTRRFGDLVALDGLSFEVEPGRMFGFVGSNGAGKTTAMRIVMGVDDPDEGTVRWHGRGVDRAARTTFGYMPEERGLYPKMTAERQLAYLGRLHGLDARAAAAAGSHWLARLGLPARGRDPVEKLSLGNQQRVQLAAALIHDPVLLVLDEPFSGLDPTGTDALSEILLERAAAGVPVVFSSHQLELVERLCDAVAIIDAGRLVASGRVAELRERGRRPVLRVDVELAADCGPRHDGLAAGGAHAWASRLPGVVVLAAADSGVLLELVDGVDDQQVLDAARAAGRVRHFGVVTPTLTELYREVVAHEDPARVHHEDDQ
jgi:ABC-2 type transport system ATP-binding protein